MAGSSLWDSHLLQDCFLDQEQLLGADDEALDGDWFPSSLNCLQPSVGSDGNFAEIPYLGLEEVVPDHDSCIFDQTNSPLLPGNGTYEACSALTSSNLPPLKLFSTSGIDFKAAQIAQTSDPVTSTTQSEEEIEKFDGLICNVDHTGTLPNSSKVREYKRRNCTGGNSFSKNAIAARDNRQKKKKYIASLEESVGQLTVENEHLREQAKVASGAICQLQQEVSYLKRVMANQSTLAAVLRNVLKTPGIKLRTSLQVADTQNCSNSVRPDDESVLSNKRSGESCTYVRPKSGRKNSRVDSDHLTSILGKYSTREVKEEAQDANTVKGPLQAEDGVTVGVKGSGSEVGSGGGICLHVMGQSVSVEFCPLCNMAALRSATADHSYVKL